MRDSTGGKRTDRENEELRKVRIERGFLQYAEGSVLIEIGNTRILCAASVEERVPLWLKDEGRGWVTAEYSLLPRATHKRNVREASKGQIGGRTSEIQRFIGRALRAVMDFEALGERTIWLDCDVLQADGGTRTAAVTGAFVALAEACHYLLQKKKISRFPIKDYVAAISAGMVADEALLDLSYEEDSSAQVDLNVVMTGSGHLIEVQGTAERKPFSRREMDNLLDLATKGIESLMAAQKDALGEIADLIHSAGLKRNPMKKENAKKKKLVLATFNEGKVKELQAMLISLPLEIISLRSYSFLAPVEETGSTFEENAVLKAEAYARATGEMVLADDSGLEVDFLGGRPGVYSARFAGEGATDEENNALLLKMMAEAAPAEREARFVCSVALAAPGERTYVFEGTCQGNIVTAPRGERGFGYDPLFLSLEEGKTFAEMDLEAKGRVSHRGRALQKVKEFLSATLPL